MSQQQSSKQSLILALNARYEDAWDEYNRLDDARIDVSDAKPPSDEHARKFRIQDAQRENQREIDALRLSILYQVPTTWQEALVLAQHVHGIFALTDSFLEQEADADRKAFETGFDTLLDFLFREIDHEGIGGYQMEASERIVRNRRRLRMGLIEEAA